MEDTFQTKQYVGAGVGTLISISDGLGPSIFCRKMEKARPIKEDMDGEVFISRQSRHFNIDVLIYRVIFSICNLTWRVDKSVSSQENV